MNFFKNISNIICTTIFCIILGLVYYRWFTPHPIIGGDWPYIFDETLREFPLLPPSWNTWQENGLGGISQVYFLQIFQNFTTFFTNWLSIPWIIVYKILWFGLFIFLAVFSSIYLLKTSLPNSPIWVSLISSLIFITNTYVLMLADGGQMGVLLAYSISPLVLALFIRLIDSSVTTYKLKNIFIFALSLSVQVMFDPRIAYLTMIIISIYFAFSSLLDRWSFSKFFHSILFALVIPGLITILIHAVWILPYILSKQNFANNFGEAYSGLGIVKFLSFATLPQTLSLLHPNWPENVFGKVSFMKGEFILIPILAFLGVFLTNSKRNILANSKNAIIEKKTILFFAFLALFGAFLAKGTNPPLGDVYLTAFSQIPGFIFFRDSTKFYIFVIISYSLLIPFCLEKISQKKLGLQLEKYGVFPILFIFFWAYLSLPALTGGLKGTFRSHNIPEEYIRLKEFLHKDSSFSRTLWVPRQQRFTFYSNNHPSVEASPLLKESSLKDIVERLKEPDTQKILQELGIKYVIVPYDSMGEIFREDRRYDEKSYKKLVEDLSRVKELRRIDGFGKIAVFETSKYNEHFYLTKEGRVSHKMIQPYLYNVSVSIKEPQNLVFAEKFNPYWVLIDGKRYIYSKKTENGLNSFYINKKGDYTFKISFSLENLYFYGRLISIFSTLLVITLVLLIHEKSLLRNK